MDRYWLDRVIMPTATAFVEGGSRAPARPLATVSIQDSLAVQSTWKKTSAKRICESIARAKGLAAPVLREEASGQMAVCIPRHAEFSITLTSAANLAGFCIAAGSNP